MILINAGRLIPLLTLFIFLTYGFSGCSQGNGTLPYDLEVNENGVGKIQRNTPFDAAKISALLPGFEAHTFTAFMHGNPYPVIRITRHDKEVMIISPDEEKTGIASIAVLHPDVKTPKGKRLGDPFEKVYDDTSSCTPAEKELAGKVLCRAPESSHLFYLFSGPRKGPVHELPSPGDLREWAIDEIIWKP